MAFENSKAPWEKLCKARAYLSLCKLEEALKELNEGISSRISYQFKFVLFYDRAKIKGFFSRWKEAIIDATSALNSVLDNETWAGHKRFPSFFDQDFF